MGEERLGKEQEVNEIMTVIKKAECVVDSRDEIQGGLDQGDEQLSEEPAEDQETQGETEKPSGLCSVQMVHTDDLSDVQLHKAAENMDVSQNAPETLQENRESTGAWQSQQDQSFLPGHMSGQEASDYSQVAAQQPVCDDDEDEEIARRAREEGRVDVVFPGSVTHDGCCRFVCELLKCVLYQRQQLPMTYDQMVFFQKQQLATTQMEEGAVRKSVKPSGDSTWHRCQRTLRDLDEVLGHLEVLFSLSVVPRVLFLLGSSGILPTELYEINLEALVQGGSDRSLRTSACLRRLFRTLFVADLLSDVKPVRLMGTTVMALAHRDCGVEWFKPKVNFKIPTRVKKQVIALASAASGSGQRKADTRDCDDYIWFQTPVAIKGFCK
ncbi:MAD2L1-binding protein [Silurus asotus]|uniref:MAD2L1-binding protein n=1 Tax=Silurus asotus TaxID=30991 RepID=A0AAD5FDK8_SILAS|nr:MAD2L1-binding protein [Silurus asotus]